MIRDGWRFVVESTAACMAYTERQGRPCNNLAKWFRKGEALCPAHARQRVKNNESAPTTLQQDEAEAG